MAVHVRPWSYPFSEDMNGECTCTVIVAEVTRRAGMWGLLRLASWQSLVLKSVLRCPGSRRRGPPHAISDTELWRLEPRLE